MRIFSSSNGLASIAAQTLVVRPILAQFWHFLTFFCIFFNVLRIFSAISWRIFKRIFCAESWGFYASNGVYSFAVAIIVTEILKDLLRPFWWIFYKFFKICYYFVLLWQVLVYIDNYFVYYCYYDYYYAYYYKYYYAFFTGLRGWLVTKTPCPLLFFMFRPAALLFYAVLFC